GGGRDATVVAGQPSRRIFHALRHSQPNENDHRTEQQGEQHSCQRCGPRRRQLMKVRRGRRAHSVIVSPTHGCPGSNRAISPCPSASTVPSPSVSSPETNALRPSVEATRPRTASGVYIGVTLR